MSIWDDVGEGDLITITEGEASTTGHVFYCDVICKLSLKAPGISVALEHMKFYGFTVKIVKKAPLPLPTVPGMYADKEGGAWRVNAYGELHYLSSGGIGNGTITYINSHPENYAPFDRLVLEKENQ